MYRLFHPGFDLDVDSDDPRVSSPDFPLMRGSDFIELMNLCFSRATVFSMTRAKWTMSTDRSLEDDLAPFLSNTIKTSSWFCYGVREDDPLEVSIFHANDETKALILKYFQEPFLSKFVDGEWKESTQTIEDLCFFSHGRLFWGTVTHENLCVIYPPDKQFETVIKCDSYWIPDEGFRIKQIDLSQFLALKVEKRSHPATSKQAARQPRRKSL